MGSVELDDGRLILEGLGQSVKVRVKERREKAMLQCTFCCVFP